MGFIKKYKIVLLLVLGLVILYFFLRFFNILHLPLFTDEAIYIRWAQIAKGDANWRFISLVDGKQPMYVWVTILFLKFFKDPLLAGRLVSVFCGLFTMIGLFFVAKTLFKNTWIGFLTAFLYVISPFALVYDRMALYESMVSMWTVWGLFGAILLVKKIRLDIALILGMIIGGGALTKGSAFFTGGLLPVSLLLFDFRQKRWKEQFFKWVIFALIVVGMAFLYYNILRLSPFFHIIAEKTAIFVYPFSSWIHHPFTFFYSNILGLWDWLHVYLTWPWLILVVIAFAYQPQKFLREKCMLFLWFGIPFMYLAFFGNTLYPRYILFMTMSLLPLVAYAIFQLFAIVKNNYIFAVVLFISLVLALFADVKILTDFGHAPIPFSDLGQYYNDWPAGVGMKEATQFFQKQAQTQKIFIATEGTFGLMPYGFEMYLVENPHIVIKGYWPIENIMPKELLDNAKRMPTYVVFYQPCPNCNHPGDAPVTWPLSLIKRYFREVNPDRYLSIYQVKP